MDAIDRFSLLLDDLARQAQELDNTRGEHFQPLFDDRLFQCNALLLAPYIEETRSVVSSIVQERSTNRLTNERAEYLTEKLTAQIEAIQRELSTQNIRKKEAKPKGYYKKSINVLYQDLAQHQEWERRLRTMVREKEIEVENASTSRKPQALRALIAAEKRLERCTAATLKLEKQIIRREKNSDR